MIDGFENAELDQAVIRIGLTVAVYSRNGDEPLPCLIQPAGRDEHVGVGVPQPHGPRQQPGPVQPRAPQDHQRGIQFAKVTPGSGLDNAQLHPAGRIELTGFRRLRDPKGALRPPHGAFAVRHERQVARVAG